MLQGPRRPRKYHVYRLPGATNATLLLPGFQPGQGAYGIVVTNIAGGASGTNFAVWAQVPLQIITQPADQLSQIGQAAGFNIAAVGTGPVLYQWRFQGVGLAGETNSNLLITNVLSAAEGGYDCEVSDLFSNLLSRTTLLTLASSLQFTLHPLSQSGVVGSSITLSVSATGELSMA